MCRVGVGDRSVPVFGMQEIVFVKDLKFVCMCHSIYESLRPRWYVWKCFGSE